MRTSLVVFLLLCLSVPLAAQSTSCAFELTLTGGADDGFASPDDPTHRSPGLSNFIVSRFPKDYDDMSINRHFGDSFKLDECMICNQICSATVEIEVQGTGGLDCNDSLFIGQAGGTPIYLQTIIPGGCDSVPATDVYEQWYAKTSSTSVQSISLDVKALQELVCDNNYPWLDVVVQDDHGVDSIKLIIKY
ncbi:MAG TPA: hypothetical protein VF787_12035 [Thermoanaerobaculia bacterium]